MSALVFIGTSGWSFQDWKGAFYPEDIQSKDMLTFYSQHFPCTEVNSTYYNIPGEKVFQNLVEKTPENFQFSVKLNRETTHNSEKPLKAAKKLRTATEPLINGGKFIGYVGQFPYSFKNNQANRALLHSVRETLPDDHIFIEFRHNSWVKEPVYQFLENNDLGYVCVDEPQLGALLPPQNLSTSDIGYIRLHGRNAKTWWNSDAGDRYDYRYSHEELQEWAERIEKMRSRVNKLYIYFNNCHHGQAPQNAREMLSLFN